NDNGQDSEARILSRMNTVDGIYSDQVELQVNVGSLDIFTNANDPFSEVTDAGDLLDEVNDFRTNSAAQRQSGLTHLFTGRNLDGSTAGIAFLGVECRGRFGVGLTQATFGAVTDALIASHEIGHNFGAEHDGEAGSACEAEPENFLMAPSISGSREFSNCTLQVVRAAVDGAACVSSLVLSELGLSAQPAPLTAQADIDAVVGFSALNEGTQALANAAISAAIPSDIQVISATSNVGNCTVSTGSVDCSVATLDPEAALDVEITVRASTGGSRTITATATSAEDTDLTNNGAQVVVEFDAAVDLVVVGGTATAQTSQAAALPIQVNNASDDVADDVVVTITPDSDLEIQSAEWTGVGT
ncbi:MAG: M12 family metallo-peptidase, partial [Pseudomonadota bacterium]